MLCGELLYGKSFSAIVKLTIYRTNSPWGKVWCLTENDM